MVKEETKVITNCFHCGDECDSDALHVGDKDFCCNGCLNVYFLLNKNGLDEYYCLNEQPGQKVKALPKEQFAFLDEASVIHQLLSFRNGNQAVVTFYLPQMHCSSCLWLLEHLSTMDERVIDSKVNFNEKHLRVSFKIDELSLRNLAEMLAHIGYEPLIDLNDNKKDSGKYSSKRAYLKLGITGFCFANIMIIAFPEYLGLDPKAQPQLAQFFKWVNVLLSIPVVFYGAREFFENAWYSIRQRYLNIDAPIALAIAVTFLRSMYEVITNTGPGFFDSMAGIVFFMLLGRTIQNRSYTTLRFNRDYKSYFPIAVARIVDEQMELVKLEDIGENEVLRIHHQEVVPTDCILSKGNAKIDYSFITGEDNPEAVAKGAIIYAGGRNVGEAIELLTVKAFNQNSFTQLWNSNAFDKVNEEKESRIAVISKYFSLVVMIVAISSFIYWQFADASMAWKAATAVLIVACPCSLLITSSFTNGYILERFAQFNCYVKNANVVERMTNITHVAFDKTGTLTEANASTIHIELMQLHKQELNAVLYALSQSIHPLSIALVNHYNYTPKINQAIEVKEVPGKGIEAWMDDVHYKIGSVLFTTNQASSNQATQVWVSVDGHIKAKYNFDVKMMDGSEPFIESLAKDYTLSLVSGDNDSSRDYLSTLFPSGAALRFRMSPQDKLQYIERLQAQQEKVMMVGDGLNDAGALQKSDVGVAIVKSSFAFSPSCDVIMKDDMLKHLPTFLAWAKGARRLINIGFGYSLIFNVVGLSFAVSGKLAPMYAAILMPASTLGIILIAYFGVHFLTRAQLKDG